jgi:hypothetical protein
VAQVLEVVEADVGKSCALKQRLEGPVHEVVAAHRCAYPRGEHESVILPKPHQLFLLFLLALMVFLDSLHGLGG